jgi:hypothetical protein
LEKSLDLVGDRKIKSFLELVIYVAKHKTNFAGKYSLHNQKSILYEIFDLTIKTKTTLVKNNA